MAFQKAFTVSRPSHVPSFSSALPSPLNPPVLVLLYNSISYLPFLGTLPAVPYKLPNSYVAILNEKDFVQQRTQSFQQCGGLQNRGKTLPLKHLTKG